jgi:uncharacterized surface protein with fasciclin (FAS1) repeats
MNLKNFLSFMKHALLALTVLITIGISGCDDDDDGPKVYDGTVLDLLNDAEFKQASGASADVALDSLVKYLSLYPDLTATLSTSTDVTLFAPSNQAFINLLATNGFPSDIRLIDPALIGAVLGYHIVDGQTLLQADLTSGLLLDTDFPNPTSIDQINVNANGTLKTGSTNQEIEITSANNRAENGVIHVVESVMIPQSVGLTLTPILGTMAGTILLGKDFTNLAKIIKAADASFTEDPGTLTFKVSTWLAMPITNATTTTANVNGFTFFAPPNAAGTTPVLTEATANALIGSPDKGRSFLLNHLVTSKQYTVAAAPTNNPLGITTFPNGVSQITPKSGKTITVSRGTASATNPYGVALTNVAAPGASDFRPIVSADLSHNNGTIQVYAGALQ